MDLGVARGALALGPLRAVCSVCGKQHVIPSVGSPWTALSGRARHCLEVRIRGGAKNALCLASVSGLSRTLAVLGGACDWLTPHRFVRPDCLRQDGLFHCLSHFMDLGYSASSARRCFELVRWRAQGKHRYEYSLYPVSYLPAYLLVLSDTDADAQAALLMADYILCADLWSKMADASAVIAACLKLPDDAKRCSPKTIAGYAQQVVAARDHMRELIEGGDYGVFHG